MGPSATPTEVKARSSPFDTGFKSKSALGQLEELSGGKVDRSAPTAAPRAVPRPLKPRLSTNQQIGVMATGMLLEAVLGNVFADNSAAQRAEAERQAAEAAASAAAQAEAQRLAEEAHRQMLVATAQSYRQDWDARDQALSDQLNGVFGPSAGTRFFGEPGNSAEDVAAVLGADLATPEEPTGDAAVVDLRGSSLVVPMTIAAPGGGLAARPGRTPDWTDTLPPDEPPAWEIKPRSGLERYGLYFAKWWWDTPGIDIEESLWKLAEKLPGQALAKELWDFKGNVEDLSDPLKQRNQELIDLAFGRGQLVVRFMYGGRSSVTSEAYFRSLQDTGEGLQDDAHELIFGEVVGKVVDTPTIDF